MCHRCRYPDPADRPRHTANALAVLTVACLGLVLLVGMAASLLRWVR